MAQRDRHDGWGDAIEFKLELGDRTITKKLPAGLDDQAVLAAFANDYRRAGYDLGQARVERSALKRAQKQPVEQARAAEPEAEGPYSLSQKIGETNRFGRYDLDVAPPELVDLRERNADVKKWEDWVWEKSTERPWRLEWEKTGPILPFGLPLPLPVLVKQPAKEHGVVAYRSLKDGTLLFEPLYPEYDPATKRWNKIMMPPRAKATGRFERPGYQTVLVEHGHGEKYGWGGDWGTSYVKGPSSDDQRTAVRNPDAYSVVQGLSPAGERQFFYFGPKLYPKER